MVVPNESVETRQERDLYQSPKVRGLEVFTGLLTIAATVVAGREAITSANNSGDTSQSQPTSDRLSNPQGLATPWVSPLVGVLAVICGLEQLIVMLLPTPCRYVRVDDDGNPPVWIHESDYRETQNDMALVSGTHGGYESDDKWEHQ